MEVLTTPSSPISFSAISKNVDESINKLDSLLEDSKIAQSEFKTHWKTLIKDYQTDVAILENELTKFPPSLAMYMELKEKERNEIKRRRKKRALKKTKSGSSHALNFHIMKQANDADGGLFILPPESATNNHDDDETLVLDRSKFGHDKRKIQQHSSLEQRRKVEEQRKFEMRENILNRLETLRNLESQMMTDHEENEEITNCADVKKVVEVERHQKKSSQLMMKMISQYKPKVNSTKARHNVSKLELKDTLKETAKLIEQNSKVLRRSQEERMIKDPDNYKSIEYLPHTTLCGSLKQVVSNATKRQECRSDEFNQQQGEGSALDDDENYSELDFESEAEEDYGSDSFET